MKFNKQPEYSYYPDGKNWRVCKNTYGENGCVIGSPGGELYFTKEEARAEVYRLNGWTLKDKK